MNQSGTFVFAILARSSGPVGFHSTGAVGGKPAAPLASVSTRSVVSFSIRFPKSWSGWLEPHGIDAATTRTLRGTEGPAWALLAMAQAPCARRAQVSAAPMVTVGPSLALVS